MCSYLSNQESFNKKEENDDEDHLTCKTENHFVLSLTHKHHRSLSLTHTHTRTHALDSLDFLQTLDVKIIIAVYKEVLASQLIDCWECCTNKQTNTQRGERL